MASSHRDAPLSGNMKRIQLEAALRVPFDLRHPLVLPAPWRCAGSPGCHSEGGAGGASRARFLARRLATRMRVSSRFLAMSSGDGTFFFGPLGAPFWQQSRDKISRELCLLYFLPWQVLIGIVSFFKNGFHLAEARNIRTFSTLPFVRFSAWKRKWRRRETRI
jgi:hypothetical protein